MTESQTFKKRSDFQSNDDYAVYVRENIQVRAAAFNCLKQYQLYAKLNARIICFRAGGDDGEVLQDVRGSV